MKLSKKLIIGLAVLFGIIIFIFLGLLFASVIFSGINFENKTLAEKYPALKVGGLHGCERHGAKEIINSNHTLKISSPNGTRIFPDIQAACDGREGVIIPYHIKTLGIGGDAETYIIDCNEVYWIYETSLAGAEYWGPFNSSGCISLLQGGMSWTDCIANEEAKEKQKVGIFKPADDEPIGAARIDWNGNYWIKNSDGMWDTNSTDPGYIGTRWGSVVIDEQPGGTNYNPWINLNESACDAYV